jgi:transcriptional regulator with XRE-family HTH domain
MNRFGTLIRQKRMERGWSLKQAAERLLTFKGYICGIERGTLNPPSPRMTQRIARLYGLDEEQLILLGYVEKAPVKIRGELRRRVYPASAPRQAAAAAT